MTEFPISVLGAFYFLLKPVVDYCRRANPLERPPATEVAAWQMKPGFEAKIQKGSIVLNSEPSEPIDQIWSNHRMK